MGVPPWGIYPKYILNTSGIKKIEVTAVGLIYFEKPSRDENIDDCQQIGAKFERTFLQFATADSISDRLIIYLR